MLSCHIISFSRESVCVCVKIYVMYISDYYIFFWVNFFFSSCSHVRISRTYTTEKKEGKERKKYLLIFQSEDEKFALFPLFSCSVFPAHHFKKQRGKKQEKSLLLLVRNFFLFFFGFFTVFVLKENKKVFFLVGEERATINENEFSHSTRERGKVGHGKKIYIIITYGFATLSHETLQYTCSINIYQGKNKTEEFFFVCESSRQKEEKSSEKVKRRSKKFEVCNYARARVRVAR